MKKALYLGVDPSFFSYEKPLLHYPVIRLIPKSSLDLALKDAFLEISCYSLFLLTSKNAVRILFSLAEEFSLDLETTLQNKCISIGPSTTRALKEKGVIPFLEVFPNTQEGVIGALDGMLLEEEFIFYPKSSLARPLLSLYLQKRKVRVNTLDLYDTVIHLEKPYPSLSEVDEVIFTSPSTVEGFFSLYKEFPKDLRPVFQGPITEKAFYAKFGVPQS